MFHFLLNSSWGMCSFESFCLTCPSHLMYGFAVWQQEVSSVSIERLAANGCGAQLQALTLQGW